MEDKLQECYFVKSNDDPPTLLLENLKLILYACLGWGELSNIPAWHTDPPPSCRRPWTPSYFTASNMGMYVFVTIRTWQLWLSLKFKPVWMLFFVKRDRHIFVRFRLPAVGPVYTCTWFFFKIAKGWFSWRSRALVTMKKIYTLRKTIFFQLLKNNMIIFYVDKFKKNLPVPSLEF